MSLILEGVDLPKGDEKLKIEIEPDGTVWIDQGSEWKKHEGAAVQILRPHGRVIDGGELKSIKSIQSADFNSIETIQKWIGNAPTILEAEEADENQI